MIKNLEFGSKIVSITILFLISIYTLGYTSVKALKHMNQNTQSTFEDDLTRVQWLNEIKTNNKQVEANIFDMMLSNDSYKIYKEKEIQNIEDLSQILINKYKHSVLLPIESKDLRIYDKSLTRHKTQEEEASSLILSNLNDQAYQNVMTHFVSTESQMNKILDDLIDINQKEAFQTNQQNTNEFNKTMQQLRITSLIILALCFFYVFLIYYLKK